MRLIQIMIPPGKREVLVTALDREEITYVVTDAASDATKFTAVVSFIVPRSAVESVLETIEDAGIGGQAVTVITRAETVISRDYDLFEERHFEETDHSEDLIAREELQAKARDLIASPSTYAMLTVISAIIATIGLLLNSPATVVGSMVIAPLIGPAMAASIGTVVADRDLFRRGIYFQALGIGLAIGSAALFALFVRYTNLVPPGIDPLALSEISERATPSFLILVIALGAGVAGILSLMKGVSTALVGVMIAVALIPPAAAVGVGIAFFIPPLIIGASVFVLVNVLSINLAALLVLWRSGYRPDHWFRERRARQSVIKQVGVLFVIIVLLSSFLGGVTYDSYVAATTEQDIRTAVGDELQSLEEGVRLVDLEVHRAGTVPPLAVERVTITVGVPPGESVPGIAERLADRIRDSVGIDIQVTVQYVEIESSR